MARSLIVAFAFGLLGFATVNGARPLSAQAAGPAAGLKAVIIVGPASGSTWDYLDAADGIASQAAAEGMSVDKIYTPHATWDRVKHEAQGANLLVFLGHGNGFPTQHRNTLSEDTEDGLGLNPYDGASVSGDVKYYGADSLRKAIKLAPNAIVLLNRLCYASGNGESGLDAPELLTATDEQQATERVDNYASGFLAIGARAVFAWGWPQKINLPGELAETDKTVDQIFEEKMGDGKDPQAFMGKYDYYRDSVRTPGATLHLDPHATYGHLRALSGDMNFTATAWRSGKSTGGGQDKTPPDLTNVSAGSGTSVAAGQDVPVFSPNGDGIDESISIDRTMSESGKIITTVADAAGKQVLKTSKSADPGPGTTNWDGTNANGTMVPDGDYTVSLTPVDKAGNVGTAQQVQVRVLTMLAAPSSSASAIEVADGDKLATGVQLKATVTEMAAVSWWIADANGKAVRHGVSKKKTPPGTFAWRWDGKDDAGAVVPDGRYMAIVSARTAAGRLAYAEHVFVGAFHITFNTDKLYRGQTVRINVYNTEPLSGPLTLTIHQKAAPVYTVTLESVSANNQKAYITLSNKGVRGPATFDISGTDINGGTEYGVFHQHVW